MSSKSPAPKAMKIAKPDAQRLRAKAPVGFKRPKVEGSKTIRSKGDHAPFVDKKKGKK